MLASVYSANMLGSFDRSRNLEKQRVGFTSSWVFYSAKHGSKDAAQHTYVTDLNHESSLQPTFEVCSSEANITVSLRIGLKVELPG